MKRSQIILIATAAVCLLLCAGAAWFFFGALAAAETAKATRDTVSADLKKIYNAPVFPNESNAAQVASDFENISAWTDAIRARLAESNLPQARPEAVPPEPSKFFMDLQNTVKELALITPAPDRVVVPAGFAFGFEKYLSSQEMPRREDMRRLSIQFAIIENLSRAILKADIQALSQFSRDVFEDAAQNQSLGRGNAPQPATQPGVQRERFTLRFTARQNGLAEIQNLLAASPLFASVTSVTVAKQNREDILQPDPALVAQVKPKDAVLKPTEAPFPPETVRVVAGPDIAALLDITIEFEVLTFTNPQG